jgi:hypothetical protein
MYLLCVGTVGVCVSMQVCTGTGLLSSLPTLFVPSLPQVSYWSPRPAGPLLPLTYVRPTLALFLTSITFLPALTPPNGVHSCLLICHHLPLSLE